MRGILAIGLVCASACSGGPGTTVFNGTDQTSPPSPKQSPINGTQQAALDPQAAPPLDPQSVPPSGSNSVGVNQARICVTWCELNVACINAQLGASDASGGATSDGSDLSVESCVSRCASKLAMPDLCTGAELALFQCILASGGYRCSMKDKDIPPVCAQALSASKACDEILHPSEQGSNQKGTGGARQGNPGTGRTGGASQGTGGSGRTGGVGQGTGGVAAF